ncbi:hypothetical protein [Paraflavitalea speifideaquila]|uniref:hypothetical protein n=1 Tax=Paraflavitalea speifideaquila TaxID=3076558 RepID=UPI0028E1A6C9|nr:hypothetical protein [Paraflavitalea speifideiaquila]
MWFTYNKNNKGALNPYVFTYHPKNPDYQSGATDRWGSYKNPAKNPGSGKPLTNADYAYALQEGTQWNADSAAANAAPWTLSEIKLPSGGKIKVTYESDDYAYVQDKEPCSFSPWQELGLLPAQVPQVVTTCTSRALLPTTTSMYWPMYQRLLRIKPISNANTWKV